MCSTTWLCTKTVADIGVETDGEEHRRQPQRGVADHAGLVGDGQRVEVDDAVECVGVVLAADPVPQGPEVVAEVDVAGWLDAREARGSWRGQASAPDATALGNSSCVRCPTRWQTPVFEGPFDLLLHLILREQVDLYEVSLTTIVDAYLAEIERLQVARSRRRHRVPAHRRDARRAEGAPAAARRDDVDLDDELALWEERDLLLARLLECKTFKDVAGVLQPAGRRRRPLVPAHGRRRRALRSSVMPDLLEGVTPSDLQAAYLRAITPKPVPRIDLFHVAPVRASVADAVDELIDELPACWSHHVPPAHRRPGRAARGDRALPRRARAVQAGPGRARSGRARSATSTSLWTGGADAGRCGRSPIDDYEG